MTIQYKTKGVCSQRIDVTVDNSIIKKVEFVGGCAGNTIADLAIIDPSLKLQCIGMVGSDADGVYVKELLTKLGVDVSGVKTTEEAPTSFTDVMTSIANKQRTFFQARGANA